MKSLRYLIAALPLLFVGADVPTTPPGQTQIIVPPVQAVPQPAPPNVEPTPDPKVNETPSLELSASVGGEIVEDDVVSLEVGETLLLSVGGGNVTTTTPVGWLANQPSKHFYEFYDGRQATFSATEDSTWLFSVVVNSPDPLKPPLRLSKWVVVGKAKPKPAPAPQPSTPSKATAAVYVYEKDNGTPPPAVLSALNKINTELHITATTYEQNSPDGNGQTPAQYVAPLAAALKQGLPALVVMAGDKVLKVVAAPKTEQEVWSAVE